MHLERLRVDGDVAALDLDVDVVRHPEDEDMVELCLCRMGARKMCDLLAAALKMTKGKKTCSWPTYVEVAPCVRPTCCRCSLFSMLQSVVCRLRGSRCAPARHLVHLAFVIVVHSGEFW